MTTYVKYIGLAHSRMITAAEWGAAGYNDQETVVWDYRNGFSVPADRFSDAILDQVFRRDPGFIVVSSDDDLTRSLPHEMTAQQAGMPRINLTHADDQQSSEDDQQVNSTDQPDEEHAQAAPGGQAPMRGPRRTRV